MKVSVTAHLQYCISDRNMTKQITKLQMYTDEENTL